jgi:FKBP-type peptidyl-prolyl cis-trans isomerase SlyD
MQITKNSVVRFHYTLKNSEDKLIETSTKGEATAYLHGNTSITKGLENAMEGKQAGDKFNVVVSPEDGYGFPQQNAIQRVPVKHLVGAKKWRKGMIATVQTDKGQRQVTVVKVGRFMAEVDGNHPLAGQNLHFDIEVIDVREATEEELSHGHAHGAGGHQH